MAKKGFQVAVVGATGAVGQQMLSVLEDREFPVETLIPFASPRSEGKEVRFRGKGHRCRVLKKGCFDGIDIAFFDASDAVSKEWVPQAAESGAWVIDNSAAFRMAEDVLLVVPEVNGNLLEARLKNGRPVSARERILAGPNCSTVQLVVALKPLLDRWGLKRVVVSTYQSVSGAGAAAVEELKSQVTRVLEGRAAAPKIFQHQIAFNCIPHIGGFKDDGYTSEERKVIEESRKILGMPGLKVTATAVRVPTLSCHAESVNVECERPVSPEEARGALKAQPGIILLDDPAECVYPMGVTGDDDRVEGASGRDAVYVGRIRRDESVENGLNLWVVSDNLRKGAALNAVQIGEVVLKGLR